MVYRSFEEITSACRLREERRVMAIAGAEDAPVIEAALLAWDECIAEPVFVGNEVKIKELLRCAGRNPSACKVVDAAPSNEAQYAVELVKDGTANLLMKGFIETRELLRPVVAKENDLRCGKLMSHVVFFGGVPNMKKLIVSTDGGMVMYPTLEEKAGIIENAVDTLMKIGYTKPSVAALCAIEAVNPKMRESVEARELQKMNEQGLIKNCTVIGPISYDIAMDASIAAHKGFACRHCGDFDILLTPDMNSGNILGKCLIVTAGAKMAGIIVGARAPIVLTSRGSSAEEKFNSIAVAALMAAGNQ